MRRPLRPRDTPPANRPRPRVRDRRQAPTPAAVIDAQLSPQGEPVLGLYLHVAYHKVMSTFSRKVGRGQVTPAIIGVITMLAEHPGISQARLARLIGLERATIGSTVVRAIEAGFVVRTDARGDARSYALALSPRGERMLRTLRRRIVEHEKVAGGHLTPAERRALRDLLHKLLYGR
ncbi:MAG TPA: MarR family winged helix-turn-helix transcriptional regulator [Vicinamibacterales bacterium]|nr:MarR family winged helix-turn-helix transcriptional regulator [Vicinamibacterales bacterium]